MTRGSPTVRLAATYALLLVLAMATMHIAAATVFEVKNTVPETLGGQRFANDLGDESMRQVLQDAAGFIQGAFSLSPAKDIPTLTLVVDNYVGVAYYSGSEIHLSQAYVGSYQPGNKEALRFEMTGVLYHESAHAWQNNNGEYGSDKFFTGMIEGVADWIRLRANLAASHWVKKRGGNWWDGYSVTAYFLDWIQTTQKANFVNELNQKMATPWSNDFFLQIVGRGVDELWQEYQNSISV